MQVPKESLKKLMVHSLPAGVLADDLLQLFAAVTCEKPTAVEGSLATEQKGKCCLAHPNCAAPGRGSSKPALQH